MKYIYVRCINDFDHATNGAARFEHVFVDAPTDYEAYSIGHRHQFPPFRTVTEYFVNDYVALVEPMPYKQLPFAGDWVGWNGHVGKVIRTFALERTSDVMVGSTVYTNVSTEEFSEIRRPAADSAARNGPVSGL